MKEVISSGNSTPCNPKTSKAKIEEPQKFFENRESKKKFVSVNGLASHLDVSPKTIYGWIYRKLIPFQKIGPRLIRFDLQEVEQWIASQSAKEKL